MPVYENESPQQLKNRLWSSVELGMYRSQTILIFIGAAVFWFLVHLIPENRVLQPELDQMLALILALIYLPVIGFFLYRTVRILWKWQQYRFYQVKLANLHRSVWFQTSYFTVVLQEPDGKKYVVNTHAIFTTHALATPRLEDYVNHSAVVGYNKETGQVVFLG